MDDTAELAIRIVDLGPRAGVREYRRAVHAMLTRRERHLGATHGANARKFVGALLDIAARRGSLAAVDFAAAHIR